MLLGPSSPAALNRWKGWQSLLKNDLGVCKALKTGWEKWNSCVCMQHTHALAHLPSPHLPESRQGGLQDHIVTFLSDLLPDHLSKKRVKKSSLLNYLENDKEGGRKKAFQVIQSFHTFGF